MTTRLTLDKPIVQISLDLTSLGEAVEMEALAQALLMKSDDFREFYEAWSAGRSPTWTGR